MAVEVFQDGQSPVKCNVHFYNKKWVSSLETFSHKEGKIKAVSKIMRRHLLEVQIHMFKFICPKRPL
jgi:hypothetical protein